jgi:DNA-binding NarL/FixJ family response regulator
MAEGTLSRRELEVLRLIALGYSGPEIAAELDLAHDTVRSHVRNAMRKAGARSRAQLVAKALGEALVLR